MNAILKTELVFIFLHLAIARRSFSEMFRSSDLTLLSLLLSSSSVSDSEDEVSSMTTTAAASQFSERSSAMFSTKSFVLCVYVYFHFIYY